MQHNYSQLDNPVWYALSESHHVFCEGYKHTKFYQPDYCPFGSFKNIIGIKNEIDNYSTIVNSFFIVGEKPALSNKIHLNKELVCLQMVLNDKIEIQINEKIIPITNEHAESLFQLVNLVQPGYFKPKTMQLGSYFGIFKNEELIAVAGERMKMNLFTEVSAIVTHPNYTGQGYAKQLIAHTVNNIFAQNKIPFLHVLENNVAAITLYKKLGFTTRRKISFWHITN